MSNLDKDLDQIMSLLQPLENQESYKEREKTMIERLEKFNKGILIKKKEKR